MGYSSGSSYGGNMGSYGGNMGSFGGSSYGSGSGYGAGNQGYSSGSSYGSGSNYGSGYSSGALGGLITGAVQSRRSVSFYDVPSTFSNAQPLTIDLPSSVQPLNFNMRTKSSPINIETSHESSPGSYQETSSVDEPHVRVHNVQRPIVQRINEVIQVHFNSSFQFST